ncbi:MAG: electron transfer flavoprotein subunit beta/FixA family protein [Anaerolineae bacterium]
MRIVVAIKQILDPEGITVNRRRERIFVNREERIINPADKCALEAALRLKDAHNATVIALSLGKPTADDALREALAMGADEAVLISDKALAGIDAPTAAVVLARAIERLAPFDLVLTGQAAADTGGDQTAGRLAELLGLPQVLNALQLSMDGDTLRVVRFWDGKPIQVRVGLPALAALSPEAPPARYPHGARILNAYRQMQVSVWTAQDLGFTAEELAPTIQSRGQVFPPERELGAVVEGPPEEMAKEIIALLRARRLL